MFVSGLGTANPPHRYSKSECWRAFKSSEWFRRLDRRSNLIVEKALGKINGIDRRALAIESLDEVFSIDPDTLHKRFIANAPALGASAGTAALPNWRLAEALLSAGTCQHVLSICVEVSSAAMYLDNDPGVLVSACLFGDGAGAAVLSRVLNPRSRNLEWKNFASLVNPAERKALLFETRGGMLRNVLTCPVPRLAAGHAGQVLQAVLHKAGLAPDDIGTWIMHPVGRDVLIALQRRLMLTKTAPGPAGGGCPRSAPDSVVMARC